MNNHKILILDLFTTLLHAIWFHTWFFVLFKYVPYVCLFLFFFFFFCNKKISGDSTHNPEKERCQYLSLFWEHPSFSGLSHTHLTSCIVDVRYIMPSSNCINTSINFCLFYKIKIKKIKTYFFYFTPSLLQSTHISLFILNIYFNKIFILLHFFIMARDKTMARRERKAYVTMARRERRK